MTRDADTPLPDYDAEPSGGDAGGETDNNQPLRHGVAGQTSHRPVRAR